MLYIEAYNNNRQEWPCGGRVFASHVVGACDGTARGGDRGRRPTAAAGARASSIYALKRAVATSAGREFRSLLARWEQAAKGPVEVAASGAGPLPEERRRQPLLLQPAGVDWGVGNMGDSSAKGCRNVEVYEKVEQVGEGTYG